MGKLGVNSPYSFPGVPGEAVEPAGLGGDPPPPKELFHRHQFKALGLELGQQPGQPLDGGGHRLVDQDDVPVPGVGGDEVHQVVGALVVPVAGIHRPADHWHPHLGQHLRIAAAKGRAEVEARAAGALEPRDGSEGPGQAAHLLLYLGGRALNQVGVVIGVVCHLVAFGRHPADLGGIEIEIRAI